MPQAESTEVGTKRGKAQIRELPAHHWAALRMIYRASRAWVSRQQLEDAGHADATLELVALDLVVLWEHPDLPETLCTLTPWGAVVCEVEVDEPVILVQSGAEVEVPRFVDQGNVSKSVTLPKFARSYRLPFPERVEDPRPGPEDLVDDGEPEYLIDEWTGEPVTLFGSYPIEVRRDRRRKGRPGRRDS